jgi:molybdopterin converting factor subunit 1
MIVNVLLFAEAKLSLSSSQLRVTLPERATVSALRGEISRRHPALGGLLARSAIAVNQRFVDDSTAITETDEVAWIPPVSGG